MAQIYDIDLLRPNMLARSWLSPGTKYADQSSLSTLIGHGDPEEIALL